MKSESKRMSRVSDVIQRLVVEALLRSAQDPRLQLVTVLSVDVSPDLKRADVYYALNDEEKSDAVQVALDKASGFIRSEIAKRSALRVTPKINFHYDVSHRAAFKINTLLNTIDDESLHSLVDHDEEMDEQCVAD